jgi:hypothetical protein
MAAGLITPKTCVEIIEAAVQHPLQSWVIDLDTMLPERCPSRMVAFGETGRVLTGCAESCRGDCTGNRVVPVMRHCHKSSQLDLFTGSKPEPVTSPGTKAILAYRVAVKLPRCRPCEQDTTEHGQLHAQTTLLAGHLEDTVRIAY